MPDAQAPRPVTGDAAPPRLSVVVTARNDNHGGDMLQRMQIFVGGLLGQCRPGPGGPLGRTARFTSVDVRRSASSAELTAGSNCPTRAA